MALLRGFGMGPAFASAAKRGAPVDADLSAHLSAQVRGDVGTASHHTSKSIF